MSLIVLRKCPIDVCRFNRNPRHADKSQIKNHILRDHDYQEKLETAANLGLIRDVSERRSPYWLAECLADFTIVMGDHQ